MSTSEQACLHWTETEQACSAPWRSEAGLPPPRRVVIGDDTLAADAAFRLASEGTAILWRGDFQNAKLLLQAMARRIERKPAKASKKLQDLSPTEAFHKHRLAQSQRSRTLGMLLIPVDADYGVPLRRAPDVKQACSEAYGPASEGFVCSLRELLGIIGAHEWRKNGVMVQAIGERIHPHYGVFSPVRGEYIELVGKADLPAKHVPLAFDIGTGTGVLAVALLKRGVGRVVATDMDPRALACASENLRRLKLLDHVSVVQHDLFPPGRAPLIVCNPPWVPARPSSPVEHAIFDPDSRMLRGFLAGLAEHLEPGGEGWLILSDFAEHLGLRSRDELMAMIDAGGLEVLGRINARPEHPKSRDDSDPLHAARAAEVTTLWRLRVRKVLEA